MFHIYHETRVDSAVSVTLGIWTCRYTTQYTISRGINSCIVCLCYPYGFMCHILTRAVHVIPMNLSIYRHSHKICFMWCFMWSIWIGVPYHETDNSVNKYFISWVWGRHMCIIGFLWLDVVYIILTYQETDGWVSVTSGSPNCQKSLSLDKLE